MSWNPKVIDWNEQSVQDNIFTSRFVGAYNSNIEYNYGDIVTKEVEGQKVLWVFDGHIGWNEIGPVVTKEEEEKEKETKEEEIFYQCKNCGAPTRENGTCEYCGTINRRTRFYAR